MPAQVKRIKRSLFSLFFWGFLYFAIVRMSYTLPCGYSEACACDCHPHRVESSNCHGHHIHGSHYCWAACMDCQESWCHCSGGLDHCCCASCLYCGAAAKGRHRPDAYVWVCTYCCKMCDAINDTVVLPEDIRVIIRLFLLGDASFSNKIPSLSRRDVQHEMMKTGYYFEE